MVHTVNQKDIVFVNILIISVTVIVVAVRKHPANYCTCYKDLKLWPPAGTNQNEQNEVPFADLAQDLTLINITVIEEPLQPGVQEAMANAVVLLCYKGFELCLPAGMNQNEQNKVPFTDLTQDLTLIGITVIEDPLWPGVQEAVAKCYCAGVTIKMCTGNNVLTARSITTQCGIFTPGGVIMEGPVFMKLNKAGPMFGMTEATGPC
ncbi:hypothetical protein DXG01_016573 [Tephrocybe rancida]|nr:hypothetical protein DXG01_016573 [Tephrocybe rancida]